MSLKRLSTLILSACLFSSLVAPRPARALEIASTITILGAGGMAIAGAILLGNADPDKKKTGKALLIAGLSISAGCATTAGLYTTLVGVALLGMTDVVRLESELDAGGGPLTDALAAGLGLPQAEVLAQVRASFDQAPVRDEADLPAFTQALRTRLLPRARLTDDGAAQILTALYEERSLLGSGAPMHWHDTLSELSGVPVSELAPTVERALDARLVAGHEPGLIVSSRSVLVRDANATLESMVDDIVNEHETAIVHHVSVLQTQVATGQALMR